MSTHSILQSLADYIHGDTLQRDSIESNSNQQAITLMKAGICSKLAGLQQTRLDQECSLMIPHVLTE